MSRILTLIGLVVAMIATGVAGATSQQPVRVPIGTPTDAALALDPASVVVEKGDHLWKISERHLGPDTSDEVVAPYWRQVVEVNTPHLRSGDPDLIFPGEVVELPGSSPGSR